MRQFHFSNFKLSGITITVLTLVFLLGVTFIAYYDALDNHFLDWDDQYYITLNPLIRQPTIESLQTLLTQIISLNYHPLTMASLWANAKISGVDSAYPFILTNVLLHLVNTALVFFLVMGLTQRKWLVAFTTAIFFGVHPMHVESVVWVSERKDVLYAFFFLAALSTYLRYTVTKKFGWILTSMGLFVFACLSKAMAVSFVPCLFLVDYLKKRDLKSIRLYIEKIPFVLIAILFGMIALDVQGGGDFYGLLKTAEAANATNPSLSLPERLSNAAFANTYYLKNFLWPSNYSAFHPYSAIETLSPLLTLSVSLALLFLLGFSLAKKWRHLLFGLGFYIFTILLVSQIIPVGSAIVAERYTYLPYIGLAYLLGFGLNRLLHLSSWLRLVPVLVMSFLGMNNFIETRRQVDNWQDHTTIFAQAVDRYPDEPLIRKYLASGLWNEGKLDQAIGHLDYAISDLGFETSDGFELLGNCHAAKGNVEDAITFYDASIIIDQDNIPAHYHRGILLLDISPTLAIEDFDYCEQSGNSYITPLIYAPRGRAFGLLGEYQNAIKDFDKAISLFPDDLENYLDRAMTYEYLGDIEKANHDYSYILQVDPDFTILQKENNGKGSG